MVSRKRTFREEVADLKTAPKPLRGSRKLRAAVDAFGVDVVGKVCLDVGASTGGFTTVLLERGATKVYAVDAGHGQLLGSLRQDPRVVNLEATNVAELHTGLITEEVDLVTVDVSYLSLSEAVGQLNELTFDRDAALIGLVKPMFELRLASAPTDSDALAEALAVASEGVAVAGWTVLRAIESTVRGAKGAIEGLIHATRG